MRLFRLEVGAEVGVVVVLTTDVEVEAEAVGLLTMGGELEEGLQSELLSVSNSESREQELLEAVIATRAVLEVLVLVSVVVQ